MKRQDNDKTTPNLDKCKRTKGVFSHFCTLYLVSSLVLVVSLVFVSFFTLTHACLAFVLVVSLVFASFLLSHACLAACAFSSCLRLFPGLLFTTTTTHTTSWSLSSVVFYSCMYLVVLTKAYSCRSLVVLVTKGLLVCITGKTRMKIQIVMSS